MWRCYTNVGVESFLSTFSYCQGYCCVNGFVAGDDIVLIGEGFAAEGDLVLISEVVTEEDFVSMVFLLRVNRRIKMEISHFKNQY